MNLTTEDLVQLWSRWEIQAVVLLSFVLQVFLFLSGGIRRYNSNTLLRLSIWLAYVGADMIAVYALGLISRNDTSATKLVECHGTEDSNELNTNFNKLAFFWAPFLLIHLGGQDTMTAFSMEDNNLWGRHLLNLSIQVSLALYAFRNSIDRHNLNILAPAILVFLAGIIRYGERTWALKCGSQNGLREKSWKFLKLNVEVDKGSYLGIVLYVLNSLLGVRDLFSGRTISQMKVREVFKFQVDSRPLDQLLKLLEVELAMMYDDLYTKTTVLRTTNAIILRCISQISMISAFVLFLVAKKKDIYSRADVAITYLLFIGGFGLDVFAFVLMAMSPWTWAFFKARKCESFAHGTWLLRSSRIGWPEKRILWSNCMGQYNFLQSCVGQFHTRKSSKVLLKVRKIFAGVERKSFIRKLRYAKKVKVNKDIMDNVVMWVGRVAREEFTRNTEQQHWIHLRPIIKATVNSAANSFGDNITILHIYTELHLRKRPKGDLIIGIDADTISNTYTVMDTCRKISNYMVYLLVVQPSMLPLRGTAEDTIAEFYKKISKNDDEENKMFCTQRIRWWRICWSLAARNACNNRGNLGHGARR